MTWMMWCVQMVLIEWKFYATVRYFRQHIKYGNAPISTDITVPRNFAGLHKLCRGISQNLQRKNGGPRCKNVCVCLNAALGPTLALMRPCMKAIVSTTSYNISQKKNSRWHTISKNKWHKRQRWLTSWIDQSTVRGRVVSFPEI